MSPVSASLTRSVADVLDRRATGIQPGSRGSREWRFDLGNGKPLPVTASWEDRWLRLSAPIPADAGAADPWRLLLLNGTLRGPARVVRRPVAGGIALEADLPLDDAELVPQRLETACTAFQQAMPALAGKGTSHSALPDAGKDAAADVNLVLLAGERGWPLQPRDPGRFTVDLDAPGLLSQAGVERQGPELRVTIEVLRSAALTEHSRRAAGLFLLTLTAMLRLVRGTAVETPGTAVRLEARLPAVPTETELDLALAALSLACRLCTRELRGLSDNLLARTYLDHMTTED